MKPTTRDAYKLMHDGALALSRVEANGICIDVDRLDRTIDKVGERIDVLLKRLEDSEEWREWKKKFGRKAKQGSRQQLVSVLQEMGYEWGDDEKTEKGNAKADVKTLESMDVSFVKSYLEIEKLKKLRGTYLKGVQKEVVDGLLHPSFNLHLVKTYRSSSDRPNFQNLPIRDPKMGKLIRSCFVPRDDHVLVEIDFGSLEVRVAACYHKDSVMLKYIETGYDMHRDMAAECFMVKPEQVSKDMRYCAKNQFVFPQFYGSYFGECAPNLWHSIDKMKLQVNGSSVKEHLAEQGIEKLGRNESHWGTGRNSNESGRIETSDFMEHIRQVQERFWGERFTVYAQWKLDWYRQYKRRGWFDLLTGFRESGVYKRNDVINHPVQGAAFHCLLWCLIELVKWTERGKMRSRVIGQIHDSVLGDVHLSELDEYVERARWLMTERIREVWDWIVVPLDVDVEIGRENWFDKKEYVAC